MGLLLRSHLSRRQGVLYSVLSIAMVLLLVIGESHGSPLRTHMSGKSSVFSLFNLKSKSKFWSESVIRGEFEDVEASAQGKMDIYNCMMAGNIANYLKLLEVDSMYLSVPVNFIFIGFEGKGNLASLYMPYTWEKRDDKNVSWQVDVDGISSIFISVVGYLQLGSTYNIFVLNPK